MATFDLGRVTPLYKGDYSASALYELNDVVLYNGNLYWHVQATATVGILPTDTTVWKLAFADEGIRTEIRGYAGNAQASADSALASKTAAAQSASQASASASQAANSAQTAQTAETGATASAQTASTKASEASASASSAASSAQTASDKAALATEKASAASDSAAIATARASAAATSETNAATSAQTATTKASEAAASATSAQEYDESAQQSAVNAQTSATNAAVSATSAQGYSEAAAQSAEDAAESASRAEAFYYLPTDTAEGAIATFTDGADNVPVKSLVVDIDPVQDLHGYDSPWPAGGGKNLLNTSVNSYSSNGVSYTKNEDGTYTVDGTAYSTSSLVVGSIELVANTQYILSGCPSGGGGSTYNVRVRDSDYTALGFDAGTETIITPSETKTYYYQISVVSGASVSNLVFKPMIRLASISDSTYAPYSNICPISGWTGMTVNANGTEIPISWESEAGTVYGGSLDVTNGVLTVDKASMTVASAGINGVANGMQIVSAAPSDKAYGVDNVISNLFATGTSGAYTVNGNTSNVRVDFRIPLTDLGVTESDSSSVRQNAVNEWIANHSTQLVYGITPITYQLTPTEVKSLLGQNNIWADTGDTNVVYRADTSAYIAKKIAEAISALS